MPKRKLFNFMPVHFLWFKNRLEQGNNKREIAIEFSGKFGGSESSSYTYLTANFPKHLTPQEALWEYRQTVKTREQRSKIAKDRQDAMTPEQKVKAEKKRQATLTPEQRSRAGKAGGKATDAKLTSEQRREKGRKGGKATAATIITEQRSKAARKGWAQLSPEQRNKRQRKAARSKRENLIKDFIYFEKLPRLNLLSKQETETKFRELASLIQTLTKKFRSRKNFKDITGVVNLAVADALSKWDKKRNLQQLIIDSTALHLIDYFGQQKKWNINEVLVDDIKPAIDALIKRRK